MTTVLVHGFWGQPEDWNAVIKRLPISASVLAPDLYEEAELSPQYELDVWTKHFLAWLHERAGGQDVQVIGYSMGARLALNALFAQPRRFRRALLLSGTPLFPPEAYGDREIWEKNWCEKFLSQPWSELESAWQDQSVFAADKPTPRRRSEKLRDLVGLSLANWSPRHHRFTWDDVKTLPSTVDWAFGASDQKYMEIAKTLQELPVQGQIHTIPNAGHRLITDAAEFISRWIEEI